MSPTAGGILISSCQTREEREAHLAKARQRKKKSTDRWKGFKLSFVDNILSLTNGILLKKLKRNGHFNRLCKLNQILRSIDDLDRRFSAFDPEDPLPHAATWKLQRWAKAGGCSARSGCCTVLKLFLLPHILGSNWATKSRSMDEKWLICFSSL